MKEVVFTKPPYMNASEQRIADMHTVLNILSVLSGELSMLESKDEELAQRRASLDANLDETATAIKEGTHNIIQLIGRIEESETAIMEYASACLEEASTDRRAEIGESISNLKSVYAILRKRMDEFELRENNPDIWIQIQSSSFREQLEDTFEAIAKNSKGAYGIQFNLAQKEESDYYFDLKMDTDPPGASLWMPLRMIDVLRDLTANARKYTPPGGKVALAIYQDEKKFSAVVEDSGCGIPSAELDKVAEYGYRASNVRERPTLGGGYGLTKAIWLVTSWGGHINIKSEVDKGTTIRLSVPNSEHRDNLYAWTI